LGSPPVILSEAMPSKNVWLYGAPLGRREGARRIREGQSRAHLLIFCLGEREERESGANHSILVSPAERKR
jgi:hypothetical protein